MKGFMEKRNIFFYFNRQIVLNKQTKNGFEISMPNLAHIAELC